MTCRTRVARRDVHVGRRRHSYGLDSWSGLETRACPRRRRRAQRVLEALARPLIRIGTRSSLTGVGPTVLSTSPTGSQPRRALGHRLERDIEVTAAGMEVASHGCEVVRASSWGDAEGEPAAGHLANARRTLTSSTGGYSGASGMVVTSPIRASRPTAATLSSESKRVHDPVDVGKGWLRSLFPRQVCPIQQAGLQDCPALGWTVRSS